MVESRTSLKFDSKSDPLASLRLMGGVVRKEIEETDRRIAHAGSDSSKLASLTNLKTEKEVASRLIKKIEIVPSNPTQESHLTEILREKEKTLAKEMPTSSIKSESLYTSSINSLRSKAKDEEGLLKIMPKTDSKMAEIAEINRVSAEDLTKKFEEFSRKMNKLDDEYQALRSKAKRDMASLNPLEAGKLMSIPNAMKVHAEELSKLMHIKDALMSKVDSSILNSAKHYLIKASKAAEDMGVREIEENINNSQRVDLCFLMDATGSMRRWITLTKQRVTEIINSVQKTYPASKFFVAVVAYRDFDQGSNSFQVLPFTPDTSEVVEFLSKVDARGGDDQAEDINGGFQRLLKLDWSNRTKILFHLADAPCHGSKYSNSTDKHPNPSSDISWEKIFREIKSLGMDYYFMRITKSTDKMTTVFAQHWENSGLDLRNGTETEPVFQVQPISDDPAIFMKVLKNSILQSMPSATPGKRGLPMTKKSMITAPLKWTFTKENSTKLEGDLIQVSLTSIDEILDKGFNTIEGKCNILIQEKPFAKGSFNYAYPAALCQTKHRMVAKKPLEGITYDENLLKLDLKKKGIALSLAHDFNQRLFSLQVYAWARISFVHTFLFKTMDEIYLLEGYIDGTYVKYSNNLDQIDSTKEIRHLTAFEHYSYEASRGEYLITDFQGVNGFLLTDPALHSRTKEFAESGDHGHEGFIRFFSKHRCNDLCKALKLKRPDLVTLKLNPWIEQVFPHTKSDLKLKCKVKFCNAQLADGEKSFCKFCSGLMRETITQNCVFCDSEFTYQTNSFFLLGGLANPKKCEECRKKKKRVFKILFEGKASDDGS